MHIIFVMGVGWKLLKNHICTINPGIIFVGMSYAESRKITAKWFAFFGRSGNINVHLELLLPTDEGVCR